MGDLGNYFSRLGDTPQVVHQWVLVQQSYQEVYLFLGLAAVLGAVCLYGFFWAFLELGFSVGKADALAKAYWLVLGFLVGAPVAFRTSMPYLRDLMLLVLAVLFLLLLFCWFTKSWFARAS